MNELPHNLDVEQAILGALLKDINHSLCRQALDLLSENSWYSMVNRSLFKLIKERAEKKEKVDYVTITDELEKRGDIDMHGGFVYIAELIRNLPSIANLLAYVEIANESAHTRDLIKMAYSVIDQASNATPGEIISMVEGEVKRIGSTQTGKAAKHISEFGNGWLDDFERRKENGGAINGLVTGITDLDQRLSGFDNEALIVLAGRPSMGKTLLAQTILDNVGGAQQKHCLFFSMEMSEKQVYERFISKASNLCANTIRSAQDLTNEDWGRLSEGMKRVNDSKIYVDTDPKLAVEQIRARIRRQISINGKQALIVIDYLGLMKLPKADRHDIAIGDITSSLKNIAKEVQTPILLLVQANREMDKTARPTMSNLKDSSAIEADADVVMFVHREEVNDPETELKGVTELIIAKDRHNDGNGTVYLVKTNGGFSSMDNDSISDLKYKEEVRKKPQQKQRGYSRGAA
jgi:replicative DNA helicase